MEKRTQIYKVSPIRKNKLLTVLTSTVSFHHYHLLEDRGNKQAKGRTVEVIDERTIFNSV